jgi:hypothetical protein
MTLLSVTHIDHRKCQPAKVRGDYRFGEIISVKLLLVTRESDVSHDAALANSFVAEHGEDFSQLLFAEGLTA